jgi:site-specific recombinase
LLRLTNSTHLLTEIGILSGDSITAGVFRGLGARLAPAPPRGPELENVLRTLFTRADAETLRRVDVVDLSVWVGVLLEGSSNWDDRGELASALVILATRVAGAGLDARLSERMPSLEIWGSPFIELSRLVDQYADAYVRDAHASLTEATLGCIDRCTARVEAFRTEKETLGTTLYLSSASLRMLQQLQRLRLLVGFTLEDERAGSAAELTHALACELGRRSPTWHFIAQKLELLAYLVIGHAAQKGDKYAVRRPSEYWGFWKKSLLGGLLVGVFASLKIHLTHEGLAIVPQAFVYGANYALCFALIYAFGGTLATKQPALTASRLAESLEAGAAPEPFAELVRAIWQSQFVSFLGNIAGAAVCAAAVALCFAEITSAELVSADEATALAKKMHPLQSGTIWYAAVAGVMLSTAGFIAGFIDNAVVFHRVADRVRAGSGVFGLLPARWRPAAAARVEQHTGGLSGNVVLGFMLGSAGAVGIILGLPIDIRHIAFASAHGALALMYVPGLLTAAGVATVVLSALTVGLVNFLVSFGLTLAVAVQARRLDGVDWRAGRRELWRLFRTRPLRFLLPLRDLD